jgi:hypothetical protein
MEGGGHCCPAPWAPSGLCPRHPAPPLVPKGTLMSCGPGSFLGTGGQTRHALPRCETFREEATEGVSVGPKVPSQSQTSVDHPGLPAPHFPAPDCPPPSTGGWCAAPWLPRVGNEAERPCSLKPTEPGSPDDVQVVPWEEWALRPQQEEAGASHSQEGQPGGPHGAGASSILGWDGLLGSHSFLGTTAPSSPGRGRGEVTKRWRISVSQLQRPCLAPSGPGCTCPGELSRTAAGPSFPVAGGTWEGGHRPPAGHC